MTEEKKSQVIKTLKESIFERYNLNTMDDDALDELIMGLIAKEVHDEYITIEERVDITEQFYPRSGNFGLHYQRRADYRGHD